MAHMPLGPRTALAHARNFLPRVRLKGADPHRIELVARDDVEMRKHEVEIIEWRDVHSRKRVVTARSQSKREIDRSLDRQIEAIIENAFEPGDPFAALGRVDRALAHGR